MNSKRILVLHAGGTIGMVPSDRGFAPQTGVVEQGVADFLLSRGQGPAIDLFRLDPLIDSADATPVDWNRLASLVVDHYDEADGFVVTHGTDTMAFTASALALALEGLNKPVILTGSMIPLFQPGSDGMRNLSDALQAAETAAPGVWVQFSGKLLSGPRARKIHSSDTDAFSAKVTVLPPRRDGDTLRQHLFRKTDIAVVPVAPGGSTHVIAYAMAHCEGVVLRCFGSGTVPGDPVLHAGLAKAAERGIPVVAISEAMKGGTALGSYAAGAILLKHGVVDGRDMTLEAAFAKLNLARAVCPDLASCKAFVEEMVCGEFGGLKA